jgi:hypothetical protein
MHYCFLFSAKLKPGALHFTQESSMKSLRGDGPAHFFS